MASCGSSGFGGSGGSYNQRANDYSFTCRIPCPPSQCTSCFGLGYHPPPPGIEDEDWTQRPGRRQRHRSRGVIQRVQTPFTEDLPELPKVPIRGSPPMPTNRRGLQSHSSYRGGSSGRRGGRRGSGGGSRGGSSQHQDQRFQQGQYFQQEQDPSGGNFAAPTQEGVQHQISTDKQKLPRQKSFPQREMNWQEALQAPGGMPRGGSFHRGGDRGGDRGQRGGRRGPRSGGKGGLRSGGKGRQPQQPHPEFLAKQGLPQQEPLHGYYAASSDDESEWCETPSPGARPSDRESRPRRPPAPSATVRDPRRQENQPNQLETERHERQRSLVGVLGPNQYPPATVYQQPLPPYMRRSQPWAQSHGAYSGLQPSFSMAEMSAALPPLNHRYNPMLPPPRPMFYPTGHAQLYNPYAFPSFGHGPNYPMIPGFGNGFHPAPTRIPRPAWNPYNHPFPNQMAPENGYFPPEYFIPSPDGSPLPGSISMPALHTSGRTTIIENGAPREVATALRPIETANPDLAIINAEYPHSYWCGRYSSGMDRWCETNPQLTEEERSDAVLKVLEESCQTQGAKNSYWRWRRLLEWRWGVNVAGRGMSGDWEGEEEESDEQEY